jgi:hypothetical protein
MFESKDDFDFCGWKETEEGCVCPNCYNKGINYTNNTQEIPVQNIGMDVLLADSFNKIKNSKKNLDR